MPVKKRIEKGRFLDASRRQLLRDGPEAMLFAGCGSHADWQRHRDRLLAEGGTWWASRFDAAH